MKDSKKLQSGRINVTAVIVLGLWLGIGLSGCGDKDAPPDYKSILKETSRYISDIEQKNEKLTNKLNDMAKKLKRKRKSGDDENAGEELEQVLAENKALTEEKETLAAELADLKTNEEKGRESSHEVTTLEKKLDRLKTKNRSLAEQKAVYEKEIAVLRKAVKENEDMAKTIEKLEKDTAKLTEQKVALEDEIADLRSEVKKGEKRADRIKSLEAENKKLADLNIAIQSRLEEIQKMTTLDLKTKKHKKQ